MAKGDKRKARDARNTYSTESTETVSYAELNANSSLVEELVGDAEGADISNLGTSHTITSAQFESSPEKDASNEEEEEEEEEEEIEEISSSDGNRKRKVDDRDSEIQNLKDLVLQMKATQDTLLYEVGESRKTRAGEITS